MLASVYKTIELRTLVRNFSQRRKRENLETAAVREYCAVPVHKLVQTARFFYEFMPRAQIQVICIRQQNLRARRFHLFGGKPLYGCLRAYGHKARRIDNAVFGVEFSHSRTCLFIFM